MSTKATASTPAAQPPVGRDSAPDAPATPATEAPAVSDTADILARLAVIEAENRRLAAELAESKAEPTRGPLPQDEIARAARLRRLKGIAEHEEIAARAEKAGNHSLAKHHRERAALKRKAL